jgi:hypothetical protein
MKNEVTLPLHTNVQHVMLGVSISIETALCFLPASTPGRVPACLFLTASLALPVVSSLLGLEDI